MLWSRTRAARAQSEGALSYPGRLAWPVPAVSRDAGIRAPSVHIPPLEQKRKHPSTTPSRSGSLRQSPAGTYASKTGERPPGLFLLIVTASSRSSRTASSATWDATSPLTEVSAASRSRRPWSRPSPAGIIRIVGWRRSDDAHSENRLVLVRMVPQVVVSNPRREASTCPPPLRESTMRCKGGGRESGQARMKSESAQGVGQSDSAVANPAALEVWGGPRHHLVSECPCALCERLRALEAELADVRKWLDATHANQQDLVMERNDAVARAEKAEARVKELEALPPGLHRHPPQTQVCGCDNRTAAALRGEDRG